MKLKYLVVLLLIISNTNLSAQISTEYKGEREKQHELLHTKLKVDFDFENITMNGEAWLTLKPYFYKTNTLVLDAKSMVIEEVAFNNKKLSYDYDDYELTINLPRIFNAQETYTVYIKYKAQPEKVKEKITGLITEKKGLYFVSDKQTKDDQVSQIWTHGQTEANSAWFPTIDAPNQKTTQEIYITVPQRFTTLSNGVLVEQKSNGETRTDYWKSSKKHAPYLVFMAVGEFEVIQGKSYKNIPVNFYVNNQNKESVNDIFGNTTEMLKFYSETFGVDYPWEKLSQIVVKDYISGAMENTGAIVHNESAFQKPGQLIDQNLHENIIAHEIAHHWFGNLVTAESWSNIALNESFANYAEYLWIEHKYGRIAAEMHIENQMETYFRSQNNTQKLVRFQYDVDEELFDPITYNKGGVILHMLRTYLGDQAFFDGLKKYLETYQFKSAEIHQLRLIFEALTGKDLNWFFNQWFYGANHPEIEVSYDYNTLRKTVTINLYQLNQDTFQFPFSIDIFEGNKRTRHTFFVSGREASFTFPYEGQPDLIQVNADNALLCKIIENKVLSEYVFQLKNAENYIHRKEALFEVIKKQDDKVAFNAVVAALDDPSYKIRIEALNNIDLINKFSKRDAIRKIMLLADSDPKTLVQAAAINTLGKLTDPELIPIFEKGLQSASYSVLGKSLVSMYYVDKDKAITKSKELPDEVRQMLATPLTQIFIEEKDNTELPFIAKNVVSGMFLSTDPKIKELYQKAFQIVSESNSIEAIQNVAEDMVLKGKQFKQFGFDKVAINLMRKMIQDQNRVNLPNRARNVALIKLAMEKLL